MRTLVRKDDPRVVRFEPKRHNEPVARALDAVRPDVLLGECPDRPLVGSEHAGLAPVREVTRRLLLRVGEREVHDVVRTPPEVVGTVVLSDDVVGRGDQLLERARDRSVVAQGCERTDLGHGWTVP